MQQRTSTARTRQGRRALTATALVGALVGAMVGSMAGVIGVGSTTAAAATTPDVTVVSSMRNVRPDEPVSGAASASVTAARNEFESFQVVVQADGQALTNVDVRLTSPIGDVPASNVTVYREEYFTATHASDHEGGRGRWGDALVPEVDPIYGQDRTAFPIPSIPADENRVAWVDVLVPLGHPAGSFTGVITVTADGGFTRTVPVTLRVLDVDLPSTSTLDSAFFMYLHGPCRQLTGSWDCGGDEELRWELGALYARVGLENRMTIANPAPLGGLEAPAATGADNERFERYFVPLTDGTSLQPPQGRPQWSPIRLPGATLTRVGLNGFVEYGCLESCTRRWKEEATSHGFADRTFLYACDEAHLDAATWDACDAYNRQAAAGWPELPWETTGSLAETTWRYGADTNPIRLHVPDVGSLDRASRAAYDTWLTTPGNELWLYTACGSFGCGGAEETHPEFDGLPGYAIDAPAVQHRATALLAYTFDVTGELYFDTLRYGCDNLYDGCDGTQAFGANGDGVLFYPGLPCTDADDPRCIGGTNPIPVESVRMKRFRDGQEDYEYLHLLEARGLGDQARAVVEAYLPDARSATPDKDATYDAMRAQLVDLLEPTEDPGDPVRSGVLAYASAQAGCAGTSCIWTMNADGTGRTRVTAAPSGSADRFPAISPDGSHIVFTRVTGSDADLWIVDADGLAPTLLLGGTAWDGKAAWSPDGRRLAFVRGTSPNADLYRMTRTSGWRFGAPTRLLARTGDDVDPAWSPDGTALAFASGASGASGWDIRRLTVAGGREEPVTGGVAGYDDGPSWSHDGARLAFGRGSGEARDVYVVGADGQGAVNVTPGTEATSESQPVFSPDDGELAYVSTADGDEELVVVPATGGTPTALTSNDVADRDPDWIEPDGSRVAPSPVRSVEVVGGSRSVTVSWQPPLHDGGSARTRYTVVLQPGGRKVDVRPEATSVVLSRLSAGTYRVTVTAQNASGPSLPVVSDPITAKNVALRSRAVER